MATISSLLADHVTLQVRSVDRLFFQGYVPRLQTQFQVIRFLLDRGFPIPSPAVLGRIGGEYVKAVERFIAEHEIPVVRFVKGDAKEEIAREHFKAAEREGRFGVVMSGSRRSARRRGGGGAMAARTGTRISSTAVSRSSRTTITGNAPRGALLYPRCSREGLGGGSLGPMAYLESRDEGDNSLPGKRRSCPGVRVEASRDPRDMAKAGLPEAESPEDAK